ncbi:MAG: zinc-ribbon domain-containing protein [Anaerolineae bacterium]|nr:zinc-ribbon domain-containing protein [Anaerolineae bacterium]
MRCPKCGHRIAGRSLFCSNCGHRLQLQATKLLIDKPAPSSEPLPVQERQGCGLSLAVIAIALAVMVAIAGVGALAVYYGMNDRVQAEQQAASEHYLKGVNHAERGELELAVAEFELALQLDPGHTGAEAGLSQVRQRLQSQPTATPMLLEETKAAYYEELRGAFEAGEWERVFSIADRLLALDSAYQRSQVDAILFEAFYRAGLQAVEAARFDEAIQLFDRALAMQPDNAQLQRVKRLASLYAAAMQHWGTDWPQTLEPLRTLYALEPGYRDVEQRLHLAYVGYGDELTGREQWCAAADQYRLALEVNRSAPGVLTKHQDAVARCQNAASPLPEASRDDVTDSAEDLGGGTTTPGMFVGQTPGYSDIEARRILVRGQVYDRNGAPLQSVRVQIRAWDWSAQAVTDANGQYAFDGLSNPVTYTLSLVDLPSRSVDVAGVLGKLSWVDFREAR